MIYYNTEGWLSQIFRFHGTVWQTTWWRVLLVMAYIVGSYAWCVVRESNLAKMPKNILGPMFSFLLVFRANSAYSRYWQARTLLTNFFIDLSEFLQLGLVFIPGGCRNYLWSWRFHGGQIPSDSRFDGNVDEFDRIVSEERTDLARFVLVVAISLHAHLLICDQLESGELGPDTRWLVDWCRYRIRCLTTADEFEELDKHMRGLAMTQAAWDDSTAAGLKEAAEDFYGTGAWLPGPDVEVATMPRIRLPYVAIFKLLKIATRNINDPRLQDKKYGMTERFITLFHGLGGKLANCTSLSSQIVTTPLPFPYFHLCRVLLFMYLLSFPCFIVLELGLWANVGELTCLSVALLGIDAIATELENPFGQDDNDLDIWEKIHLLEQEVMFFTRLSGDEQLEQNFLWQEMPGPIADLCLSPVSQYLTLREQVATNGQSEEVIRGERASRDAADEGEGADVDDDSLSDDS